MHGGAKETNAQRHSGGRSVLVITPMHHAATRQDERTAGQVSRSVLVGPVGRTGIHEGSGKDTRAHT